MAEKSWTEQAIDEFFAARKSPTRSQCDQRGLPISGGSAVRQVDVPGSLSYTVVCIRTEPQSQEQEHEEAIVVSFGESESGLDRGMVELARVIHGCATRHFTMPLLLGVVCLEALSYRADMNPDEEAKHFCFVTHLARYNRLLCLAERTYLVANVQSPDPPAPSAAVPISTLSELETILPLLFASEYPQVLRHGNISKANVLVKPDIYEVTGIVDWSFTTVQPFGIDLDCVFLMTGYMDLSGWHNYAYQPRLLTAFWAEFWTASGIEDNGGVCRENVRATAEAAAKIGVVLRCEFDRNADGCPSEMLSTSDSMSRMLNAWFGH